MASESLTGTYLRYLVLEVQPVLGTDHQLQEVENGRKKKQIFHPRESVCAELYN